MSNETAPTEQDLKWASLVWGQCQRFEAQGLLYAALSWDPTPHSDEYLTGMSLKPWDQLGHVLQGDVVRQLRRFHRYLNTATFSSKA